MSDEFIAAANPQAVIELLDRISDLERRNGELEKALRDVNEWAADSSAQLEALTSDPLKTIVFEMPDGQSVQLLESMRPGFNVGVTVASALLDELPALTRTKEQK